MGALLSQYLYAGWGAWAGAASEASRVAAATDAQGGALAAQKARLGATLAAHAEGQREDAHTATMAAAKAGVDARAAEAARVLGAQREGLAATAAAQIAPSESGRSEVSAPGYAAAAAHAASAHAPLERRTPWQSPPPQAQQAAVGSATPDCLAMAANVAPSATLWPIASSQPGP